MLPTAREPAAGRGGAAGRPGPGTRGGLGVITAGGDGGGGDAARPDPAGKSPSAARERRELPAAPRAWPGGPRQEGGQGREWTRRSGQRLSRAPKPGARTPPPPPPPLGRSGRGGGAGGAGATQGEGATAAGRGPG